MDGDPYGLEGNIESPLETWKASTDLLGTCMAHFGTGDPRGRVSLQSVCYRLLTAAGLLVMFDRTSAMSFLIPDECCTYRCELLRHGKNVRIYNVHQCATINHVT